MARIAKLPWTPASFRALLLSWYGHSRRDLPWRRTRDSYAIWVSEIMLQQTRVAAVIDRYRVFLEHFPTVTALAAAPVQDVLVLWSGLGYYRRARMLHKAAQVVAENLGGVLPATSEELRALPGIGAYTAAAIASIAHGETVAVVDGNVERVVSRVAGLNPSGRTSAGILRKKIDALAEQLVDPEQPGDFNQAMMELGATVCTPKSPQCLVCPVSQFCVTRGEHKTTPRPAMTTREAAYALVVDDVRERVLLEQRGPEHTVMPGMWELPGLKDASVPEEDLRMTVRHAIMQVNYFVRIRAVHKDDVAALTNESGVRRWAPLDELHSLALTGLARKVLTRARLMKHRVPALAR
jgi:A/G-specific adenine glycosylase